MTQDERWRKMYDGRWKMDDVSRKLFERLLALCEQYRRVNQYQ